MPWDGAIVNDRVNRRHVIHSGRCAPARSAQGLLGAGRRFVDWCGTLRTRTTRNGVSPMTEKGGYMGISSRIRSSAMMALAVGGLLVVALGCTVALHPWLLVKPWAISVAHARGQFWVSRWTYGPSVGQTVKYSRMLVTEVASHYVRWEYASFSKPQADWRHPKDQPESKYCFDAPSFVLRGESYRFEPLPGPRCYESITLGVGRRISCHVFADTDRSQKWLATTWVTWETLPFGLPARRLGETGGTGYSLVSYGTDGTPRVDAGSRTLFEKLGLVKARLLNQFVDLLCRGTRCYARVELHA